MVCTKIMKIAIDLTEKTIVVEDDEMWIDNLDDLFDVLRDRVTFLRPYIQPRKKNDDRDTTKV